MKDRFNVLKQTLKDRSQHGPVHYMASPGNWGGALIRHGTLKFFKEIELDYQEIIPDEKGVIHALPDNTTVIYGGGGGWCHLWNHSQMNLKVIFGNCKVIVLPSTYEMNYAIPNTVFFCRDKLKSKRNMPDAIFCHDMAFCIGKRSAPKGNSTGYFFRTDKESRNAIRIPKNNHDPSAKGDHYSDIGPFFDAIARFEIVHTDRLQVAIAACLMGKEVHVFPGSYFKNRAVFRSSLKHNFKNVFFHEAE
jgi:exopolysaccharide biosynthesis predicted pyruvyltransferase EpsI